MQRLALTQRLRISFLSGDVHCAAVGVLKTYRANKKEADVPIGLDHRYMLNIVTSMCICSMFTSLLMSFTFAPGAIVNTPP